MKMMTDDPAWALAQHVCRTSYADLPASAVESARRDILDTFGCMLGGSGSPGIRELFAVVSRWGGLAESRVLLRGVSLPSPQTALLNASMGHALDFDDAIVRFREAQYLSYRLRKESGTAKALSDFANEVLKPQNVGFLAKG